MNLEWVGKYKWWIVGAIVGLGLLYILWSNSSSGAANTSSLYQGPTDAQVAAAEQLQAMQMQVGGQVQGAQLQLQSQQEQDATQLALAKLQADAANNTNTLAANVASQQISAQFLTQTNADTLSAQVAENTNATQQNIANIEATNTTQQQQNLATALLNEASIQANAAVAMNSSNNAASVTMNQNSNSALVANATTAANAAVATANTAANAAVANQASQAAELGTVVGAQLQAIPFQIFASRG